MPTCARLLRELLLDHPVRPLYKRLRNRQTKRLRGRGIDDQLELRGLLDGKFGWLRALEDLVDVGSGQPNDRIKVRPITEECSALSPRSPAPDNRWLVASCELQYAS